VVILLLALAAGAFFVLRGPSRNRTPVESASVLQESVPPTDSSKAAQPTAAAEDPKASEDRKKAAEDRRKAEQDLASIEAQKKAGEAKVQDKSEKKGATPQEPIPSVPPPQPALPAAQPADTGTESGSGHDACVLVSVTDVDGKPVPHVRVSVIEQPDSASPNVFNGLTGGMGRMQKCGLTPGHRVRVAVLGPRGAMLASRAGIVTGAKTFITINLPRSLEDAPQLQPKRKRPFFQRP
jgi:hypothetical protein